MSDKTMEELVERRAQIAIEIDGEDADLDALEAEARAINEEIETRKANEAKRNEIRAKVASGEGEDRKTFEEVEKKMTLEEVRSSKAYVDAFAEYIKSGDDKEVRALLTENVSGVVPVPTVTEERIRTAWSRLGLIDLARKTYIRGNLRIGFELSASEAVIHTEGSDAISAETLTFGVVTLLPQSIKKLVQLSDEVMDLKGSEFLDYVYDEITYQIAKKAQKQMLASIVALTASATPTAVSVPAVVGTPTVGVIAEAIGNLADNAESPVVVMNKGTWSQFKAAQYAGSFNVDPFEGLPVYFDNSLAAYTSSLNTGTTWAIVGDFGVGAHVNFPNGDEINIKFDDITAASADLVNIIGREYVGIGIVSDKAFVKLTKGA